MDWSDPNPSPNLSLLLTLAPTLALDYSLVRAMKVTLTRAPIIILMMFEVIKRHTGLCPIGKLLPLTGSHSPDQGVLARLGWVLTRLGRSAGPL